MRFLNEMNFRLQQSIALTICAVGICISSLNAAGPNFVANTVTTNQTAVGSALDNVAPLASGGLLSMINSIAAETPAQQQFSLGQLSGEMFGSTQTIGLQVGDQFQQRITGRMINNGQFLAGAPSSESVGGADSIAGTSLNTNNVWIQGYGVGGSLSSDGNGSGVRYSQGGGFYGFDLGADDSGSIGIAAGNSYVGFDDGFGGYGQLNAYQIGVYALKHDDVGYVLGSANYGYDSFRSTRNVTVGSTNQSLHGSYIGNQFGAYAESGLKFHAGWVHLQPLVALQYLYLSQQGFGESGGSAALNVSGAQASSLRANIGGRLVVDQLTGPYGAVWTPYWQLRLVTELLDNDRSINASFVDSPAGGSFTAHGTHLSQNYLLFGKGLQVQLTDQWSFFGNAELLTFGRIHTEAVAVGLAYTW